MPARKRGYEEIDPPGLAEVPLLIKKLRNQWQFAALMQYIFIFGDVVKIDKDFDIEVSYLNTRLPNNLRSGIILTYSPIGSGG